VHNPMPAPQAGSETPVPNNAPFLRHYRSPLAHVVQSNCVHLVCVADDVRGGYLATASAAEQRSQNFAWTPEVHSLLLSPASGRT
jgi:hypothetical protein